MNRLRRVTASLLFAAALCTLCGCGNSLDRQEISGEVKLKGQPIVDGVIRFEPVDGQGTGEGAQIDKGKYRIPKDKGLSPGKYRVHIWAGDGRSGVGNASPDSPNAGVRPGQERVPAEYNDKSNVIKEVVKGADNRFDFDIK